MDETRRAPGSSAASMFHVKQWRGSTPSRLCLRDENERQNLVSTASLDQLWLRHIADSAQLLRFAPVREAELARSRQRRRLSRPGRRRCSTGPVTLVEERRLRADFLRRAAEALGVRGRDPPRQGRARCRRARST